MIGRDKEQSRKKRSFKKEDVPQVRPVPFSDMAHFRTREFWENLAINFCVFSVVGHWMEVPYCLFMNQFGIVDENSLVWDDLMYPFLVYGVGVAVCACVLVPQRAWMRWLCGTTLRAVLAFFVVAMLVSLAMELAMGLLLNQPSAVSGEYPLWDNSQLPGNIFGQAWIVNDVCLGAVATLYTWAVYPATVWLYGKLSRQAGMVLTGVVVVGFVALCAAKF